MILPTRFGLNDDFPLYLLFNDILITTYFLISAAVESCKTCPAGYYCPSGTDTPQPCPMGTFNPYVGQNELTDCTACTAGSACTQIALDEPDTHCYPG